MTTVPLLLCWLVGWLVILERPQHAEYRLHCKSVMVGKLLCTRICTGFDCHWHCQNGRCLYYTWYRRLAAHFSGGRSSGLELSATASPGCFVDRLISAGTENLPVFIIISCCLTW